jgi:hypothetical protein
MCSFQLPAAADSSCFLTLIKLSEVSKKRKKNLKSDVAGRGWLTHTILAATQEAAMRRITVQSQPKQIVHKTLS